MLDFDKDWFFDRALKGAFALEVKDYVLSLIRHTELTRILNKKSFRDAKVALDNAHVDIDAMRCKDEIVYRVLREKAAKFIKDRDKVKNLYEICSELPTINEITSLCITDQVHIILIAHTIFKDVIFDNNIFDSSKGGVQIPFQEIYENHLHGQMKIGKIKDILRPVMHRLLGNEGRYFYGIKIKKSDYSVESITYFLNVLYRDWGKKNPISAFTDFCAVLLYGSESDYEIVNKNAQEEIDDSMQIGYKDFLIRCNVFKCMHEAHRIRNVVGLIRIINDEGKIQTVKISAGFCPECNIYFILESVYKSLITKGTIMCRVTDEKNYARSGYMNGQKLSRESILMQYGYNVSRAEGLSNKSRQKILGIIIDNKILSKSEIISYLDFFINQRLSLDNMKDAVAKWKEDRRFVENYKNDEYAQVGVNSIYRC